MPPNPPDTPSSPPRTYVSMNYEDCAPEYYGTEDGSSNHLVFMVSFLARAPARANKRAKHTSITEGNDLWSLVRVTRLHRP